VAQRADQPHCGIAPLKYYVLVLQLWRRRGAAGELGGPLGEQNRIVVFDRARPRRSACLCRRFMFTELER
jgi:hypothetical protein